jgi:hypothetical protein
MTPYTTNPQQSYKYIKLKLICKKFENILLNNTKKYISEKKEQSS